MSFSWTTPALLARQKSVTRRDWKDSYARQFKKGDLVQAYDKSPRYGGKKVGVIRLTEDPKKEMSNLVEDKLDEYVNEGFYYLKKRFNTRDTDDIFNDWVWNPRPLWVVRFEVVSLEGND